MNATTMFRMLESGVVFPSEKETELKLPQVPSDTPNIRKDHDLLTNCAEAKHVAGPARKVILTLTALEMTVRNTEQGVGIKLLDFPEGAIRIKRASGSLTFTTTSVLADTLNAATPGSVGSVIKWSVGTTTQSSTGVLVGTDKNIVPETSALSSHTINVANTATTALNLPDLFVGGSTTAADVYLNVIVPTAGDIDADATVAVDGTLTIEYEYAGDQTVSAAPSRMPTASLWKNCPWEEIASGRRDGIVMFDDFTGNFSQETNQAAGVSVTTKKSIVHGGWSAFTDNDAGNTVTQNASAPYGVVELNVAADNFQTTLAWGGNAAAAGQIVFEAGKKVWFETRVKINSVTDSKSGAFVGFGEEALCVATGILADAGTLTDKDLIGFHRLEADGDKLDIIHNTASGGGVTSLATDAITLVADTYVKLGIYCDGTTVYFYADGTQVASVALTATNVPDGEEMVLYYSIGGLAVEASTLSADWVKIAQER